MKKSKTVKEPLFHIAKAPVMPAYKNIIIKVAAVLTGLILSALICAAVSGNNPFDFFVYMFKGAFGSERKINVFFRDMAILLCVALALLPAFKMKFWNLGGNGQIMVSCIASISCIKFLGGVWPDWLVITAMIVSGIAAGAVWAVIPALFKAFFKTNESLFTLMMNYIAVGLAGYFITRFADGGSGTIKPVSGPVLPDIGGEPYLLSIIVVAVITVFMFVYFKFGKHGYEVAVVGESENTARYVGINVKKVLIRTMALSGAVCGIVGVLLVGSINHTITVNSANNMGFTAIMVAWLGKLDPLIIIVSSFFITFIDKGMSSVNTGFGLTNSATSNIVLGLIYFFIIGCEFFISYVIKVRGKKKEPFGNFLDKNAAAHNETTRINETGPENNDTTDKGGNRQ